jgi:hypothetical protein
MTENPMPLTEEPHETRPEDTTRHSKGSWYLLTGLVLGLILGLLFAWVIDPVVYRSTEPATLKENAKETYRLMIAQAYAATGNLERAKQRLALLEDDNMVNALGAQAQRALANGKAEDARTLALLAAALQSEASPLPTSPPDPTQTPNASAVPTQTLPALTPIP